MSRRVRVFQVDAFTSQRFCGNPAGVVLDADCLTETEMRALARELNGVDTAFLLQPDAPDHDLRVRFFNPRGEAAFVGHATLAAHAVLAALGLAPRPRQKQKSGLVEVETLCTAPPRIAIRQPPPRLDRVLEPEQLESILEALALGREDLDPRCPAMIAGASSTRLLIGVRGPEVLGRVRADLKRLAQLSPQIGAPGYFLFALQFSAQGLQTEARMFCPALGIDEDPVSGNAHALLATYLLHHGLIELTAAAASADSDTIAFTGMQGQYVGRPGRVAVTLEFAQHLLRSVSISGEAVIVFATAIDFP